MNSQRIAHHVTCDDVAYLTRPISAMLQLMRNGTHSDAEARVWTFGAAEATGYFVRVSGTKTCTTSFEV